MSRDFLDHVGASFANPFTVDHRVHIHPRPRGDLVLCDGRCGASLPLKHEYTADLADAMAHAMGWLVTSSMLRSFHHCPQCRATQEDSK